MQQMGYLINHIPDLIDAIDIAVTYLANLIEYFAALIIGIAAVQGMWRVIALFRGHDIAPNATEDLRLRFARWLAVALEFELGADILRTAVSPGWSAIGQLAAIAAIRTGLNFFLEREIQAAAKQQAISPTASPSAQQKQSKQTPQSDEQTPADQKPATEGQHGAVA